MSGGIDFAGLYPFLYQSAEHAPAARAALLDSVRRSTLAKCAEVISLRAEMIAEYAELLPQAAAAMAERFDAGAKLLAFGNGGSATDADDAAADCLTPPHDEWRALPALSLPAESATLTALANDVGLESVFSRQIAALGERGDIALGFSTSGNSTNVVAAVREARRRGMLTIAMTGYDGGELARSGDVDFCFVARREFVPRIQEGHATLWHALLGLVQSRLGERGR
jgi:D-sedoheptulose 7-phosphate isomerase